jgi:hypothetical protein
MPAARKSESQPSWSDVKAKLADFDRVALIGLVADLYALSKTNQSFLHARFSLGKDSLATYKRCIHDALSPDSNKPVRVADAKKAISEYRKAIGRPEGLLELRLFWCEAASSFSMEFGYADEGYFDALLRQFEAALKALSGVNETSRKSAIERLVAVRDRTDVGYGVKDDMNYLLDRTGVAP